jgi:hypothetical protein
VSEALDPPAQCSFLVGEPKGALVEEVLAGSAADGLLLAGDVIVTLEGEPTPSADALVGAMAGKSPGDQIEIEYLRGDEEGRASMQLGASPDDPDKAMIGVLITTEYETILASDAAGPIDPGVSTRPISIGDRMYLFDPIAAGWERTEITVPAEVEWVATTRGVYALDEGTLSDLVTGEDLDLDELAGWDAVRAIGSIGPDLILFVTQPVTDAPDRVTVGVARFDPEQLETIWAEPVLAGFGIPVTAAGSPNGDLLALTGVSNDGTAITGVQVWDGDGFDTGLTNLLPLGAPVGWLDDDNLMLTSEEVVATRLDVTTGESEQVILDAQISGLPIFPVGDGHSLLAVDGRTLVLDDLEQEGEVRVLAQDCTFNRVGEPGWGT